MNAKTTEDKALSKIERLQIANQFRILSKLTEDKHDSEHYELSAQIFENGYTSLYFEALHNFSEELSENVSEEVELILQLYTALKLSVQDIPETERGDLLERVKFGGFDANNEATHLSYARFLVDKMGQCKELHIFNSHMPTLAQYRSQLQKWNELNNTHYLKTEQIEQLLAAKKYWVD